MNDLELTNPGPMSALLSKLVEDRVEKALSKAVVAYRNGTISPQDAHNVIAQIAGLRALCDDLAATIKALR